ncbi:flagellar motor switch protein FliN (plasmid) [Enterobacter asburiae]|uniref:flagellar motor switch protein FliN n=1 Tax=Enterobacter asburiae TaxID=61645 RepID=UPI002932F9B0|nr:flagellar motor switch protein FliN [Enterobacter asburiae]EMA4739808.1 flagellar motor switch protein FliN [Enterobacter asburiae]
MTATTQPSDNENESSDDLWGDAMSEQQAMNNKTSISNTKQEEMTSSISQDLNLILDIPVKMTVELGRTKMTIKELLSLSQGAVVTLDGLAGEPLDILINGYLIAQGEVVVVSDKFGIRITDIITPSERIHRLSR